MLSLTPRNAGLKTSHCGLAGVSHRIGKGFWQRWQAWIGKKGVMCKRLTSGKELHVRDREQIWWARQTQTRDDANDMGGKMVTTSESYAKEFKPVIRNKHGLVCKASAMKAEASEDLSGSYWLTKTRVDWAEFGNGRILTHLICKSAKHRTIKGLVLMKWTIKSFNFFFWGGILFYQMLPAITG